ncbi:cold shock domain-containing protein CspD [Pseudomonas gessardii]|uniref:cold shock domain-containing protein CspD n=1 Tax=Pseudomonas gessardii TaxID=78544 RepID=UPI001472D226|nr:cold shock domain-containing protein CspD [Pseudomonas gessardii]MBH3425154.1 cold shock domain-containing protein CspD [Pseudomonas gessardii]NNA89131.1 cold shock domain-containing protein CspD [Pseudomonas gessardii]
MSGVKISGKVKWFNNAKGYGFINEDGKEEDLFAHYSAITMEGYKTLKAGQLVTFEIIQGPKGLHAVGICAACASAPGKPHDEKEQHKAGKLTHPKNRQTA